MADLRSKFIEDYAGGLLNVSRQELASTGQVLSQDGLLSGGTLFVEDGTGTKSGLKLGVSLCESVDPTTDQGVVNVRYANRTYANIRDLKIFSTAVASAQAALADATSSSITNLENAFQLLETDQESLSQRFEDRIEIVDKRLEKLDDVDTLSAAVTALNASNASLGNLVEDLLGQQAVSLNTIKSFIRTGNNNKSTGLDFYKTRGADKDSAGGLRIDDEIAGLSFLGSDGFQKVLGAKISGVAAQAWDNGERPTYIGFNWCGNSESGNGQTPSEWIAFGKLSAQGDTIGSKTLTFLSAPTTTGTRPNMHINGNGQLTKTTTPGITLAELKTLTAAAADFAAFKSAIAGLT